MSIIRRMRRQTAVFWARQSTDRFGEFTFAAPVQVTCRWEDVAVEFVDNSGEKALSQSLVYVDRVMLPGDRLLRGSLEVGTPVDPIEAASFEIRRFDQLPNLRATETLLTAYL